MLSAPNHPSDASMANPYCDVTVIVRCDFMLSLSSPHYTICLSSMIQGRFPLENPTYITLYFFLKRFTLQLFKYYRHAIGPSSTFRFIPSSSKIFSVILLLYAPNFFSFGTVLSFEISIQRNT